MAFLVFFSFPFPAIGERILRFVFFKGQTRDGKWKGCYLPDSDIDDTGALNGSVERRDFSHLIGLDGIVLNDLKPHGTIEVKGVQYDAVSEFGVIPKGTLIRVIEAGAFDELIVRANDEDE